MNKAIKSLPRKTMTAYSSALSSAGTPAISLKQAVLLVIFALCNEDEFSAKKYLFTKTVKTS